MADEKLVEKETEESIERVKFIYTKSPDYKVAYVNGIYGGLTAKGELKFDFFQEFSPFPDEELFEVTPDGRKGEQIQPDLQQEAEVVREKQFGVIMTVAFAKALRDWLDEKLDTYAQMKLEQEEGGVDE